MAINKENFYKQKDEYYSEPTFVTEYPEGTVAWYSPIITPEERERRMNEIKEATANFMRYVLATREQKEREKKELSEKATNSENEIENNGAGKEALCKMKQGMTRGGEKDGVRKHRKSR